MIAFVQGTVLVSGESSCVVLSSGGVGYEVYLPAPLLARLPGKRSGNLLFRQHHCP